MSEGVQRALFPMSRSLDKPAILRLSVEEENLASIPFAVLESRVGKRISKLEIRGTKVLPDGREAQVCWQVQGNTELGLPTEQDLDIFVALGVLTFRNNFAKTVTFTGREIAKILGIRGVHGKFYQRLKLAMDRFVPLRFRSLAATDCQEEIKWLNVFQEASFTLDRTSGRCVGTITWTDKLIQSMNSGFFRVLDASRYMNLDGITGKHMYRFLAVAFEKTDVLVIDARKLSSEHLGIVNVPKYFSRLLQTLEPAFDQLIRVGVLGSYHVINSENWEIALHRHKTYVPERKNLLLQDHSISPAELRDRTLHAMCQAGFDESVTHAACAAAKEDRDWYQLQRATRLLEAFLDYGVLPHIATAIIEGSLREGIHTEAGLDQLDWCEIALNTCQNKLSAGQKLKNPAGLIVRLARDKEAREKMIGGAKAGAAKKQFRQYERQREMERHYAAQREFVLEYEHYRMDMAKALLSEMPEAALELLRSEKREQIRQQGRWERMDPDRRREEIEDLTLQEIAKRDAPPFEKWLLRKRAAQAVLPFHEPDGATAQTA